jgi:hypothetical protein
MRKLLMAVAVVAAALVPSLSHAAPATTNLALGSVATASSQESSAYPGSLAVDGDATTRRVQRVQRPADARPRRPGVDQ